MLDLGRAERGAVQRCFLELAREVEVVARLALRDLQHSADLWLVGAGDRAGASRHTVDVQRGRGAVKGPDQVVPGIPYGRVAVRAEHRGAAIDPELPAAVGSLVQNPAQGVLAAGHYSVIRPVGGGCRPGPNFNRESRRRETGVRGCLDILACA